MTKDHEQLTYTQSELDAALSAALQLARSDAKTAKDRAVQKELDAFTFEMTAYHLGQLAKYDNMCSLLALLCTNEEYARLTDKLNLHNAVHEETLSKLRQLRNKPQEQ